MPLRSLVTQPEEFAALEALFEEAWKLIDGRRATDPLRVPAQRERLAYIVMGLWKSGSGSEGQTLVAQSVEQFFSAFAASDIPCMVSRSDKNEV